MIVILLSGCAIHPPIHPDLGHRLSQIHTVGLSPAYVEGYIQPYFLHETRRTAVSDTAITNLATAIHEQFGQQKLFVVEDLDMRDSALAPPTPPWELPPFGPVLPMPDGMNFKPKALAAPPPEIEADAALFAFAWQRTSTAGGIWKKTNPLVIWLLPIELVGDFVGGRPDSLFLHSVTRREVCLGLCLIDSRTGEVLWSDIETVYGLGKVEDPKTVRRLVGNAYKKFAKYVNAPSTKCASN